MNKRLASVALVVCSVLNSLPAAAVDFISTHRSRTYAGLGALETCESVASVIKQEFPVAEAAELQVQLIDVVCEPQEEGRVVLSIVYGHSSVSQTLKAMGESRSNREACLDGLATARENFREAGLPVVSAFCTKSARLIVEYIDARNISTEELNLAPEYATLDACHAGLHELALTARRAGLSPLLGTCHRLKAWDDETRFYYSYSFQFALPLGRQVSVIYGRNTASREECEAELPALDPRFAAVGAPILQGFCMETDGRYVQTLQYLDELLPRVRTYEGSQAATAARCGALLAELIATLERSGNRILHAYCDEHLAWDRKVLSYQAKIHYAEPALP